MQTDKFRHTAQYVSDIATYYENDSRLEEYQAIFPKIAEIPWSHMVTLTSATALTDEILAEKICGEFRKRLDYYLYGRHAVADSRIKYCFLIENHTARYKGLHTYHIHALVTYPTIARKLIHYCSLLRYVNVIPIVGIAESYSNVLSRIAEDVRRSSKMRDHLKLGHSEITPIDSTEGIADYLLKEFRHSRPYIAWQHSDITWQKSAKSIEATTEC